MCAIRWSRWEFLIYLCSPSPSGGVTINESCPIMMNENGQIIILRNLQCCCSLCLGASLGLGSSGDAILILFNVSVSVGMISF